MIFSKIFPFFFLLFPVCEGHKLCRVLAVHQPFSSRVQLYLLVSGFGTGFCPKRELVQLPWDVACKRRGSLAQCSFSALPWFFPSSAAGCFCSQLRALSPVGATCCVWPYSLPDPFLWFLASRRSNRDNCVLPGPLKVKENSMFLHMLLVIYRLSISSLPALGSAISFQWVWK